MGSSSRPRARRETTFNSDNWYIVRAAPHFEWERVFYKNLAGWCTGAGFECNGIEKNPLLVNPAVSNYTLRSTSPDIDRGVVIPGINDGFTGSAPDIGAFEYGTVKP